MPDGARFCPNCGAALAVRGDERRVVTVVFADLVGFTSLAESRDPETVKNLVDGCFEHLVAEVHAFGGRVDKIIGDAIVALFGAPEAHEDDAERAVRAALRMQAALAEHVAKLDVNIQMRIGVNTGEVLVGALRSGGDYTAMGDVVNVAQRLQTAAEPGQVIVGAATHTATHRAIIYTDRPPVDARNREEPVEAWVAEIASDLPGRRPRRTRVALVGRDEELRAITAALGLTLTRNRTVLVVVIGDGGVGKGRLVEEAADLAEAQHAALVLEGRCVPYGEMNPWFPIAEAIRGSLGVGDSDTDEVFNRRVTEVLERLTGNPTIEIDVPRTLDALRHLFGRPDSLATLEPNRQREEVNRAILALLAVWSESRPVIVAINDLQWSDERVTTLLGFALERLSYRPIAVMATTRSVEDLSQQFSGARHTTLAISLDPLERDAAAELLDSLLSTPLDSRQRTLLLDRSGGNPLFLEELASALGEGSAQAVLPDTLRGLVLARLERLQPEARAMLENAALLGSSGAMSALFRVGQLLGQHPSRQVLNDLTSGDLLELAGERWRFTSESFREVAYSTMTKAVRVQRHLGVARALEELGAKGFEDQVGHHLASAAELGNELGGVPEVPPSIAEEAAVWLMRAASRARSIDSQTTAVRLTSRALALVPVGSVLGNQLLIEHARGLLQLRRLDEARAIGQGLVAGPDNTGTATIQASARITIAIAEQMAGNMVLANEWVDDGLARWRAIGDRPAVAEALRLRGFINILRFDVAAAEEALSEAQEISIADGDRRGAAWSQQHLAWLAFIQGKAILAEERLDSATATFAELGDKGGLGWAAGLRAWVHFQQGRSESAEAICRQVRAEAEERGDRWATAMMVTLQASLELWRGHAERAAAISSDAVAVFRQIGDAHGQSTAYAPLIRSRLALGELNEVQRLIAEARELGEKSGQRAVAARVTTAAAAHLGAGGPVAPHEELATRPGLANVESLASAALLSLQRGELDAALGHLSAATALAEQPEPYLESVRSLVLVAAGDLERGVEAAEVTLSLPGVSYLDGAVASLALALATLREGDVEGCLAMLHSTRLSVDVTDDRVAQLIIRIAELQVRDRCDLPADEIRWVVAERVDELGADLAGWRQAISLGLGALAGDTR